MTKKTVKKKTVKKLETSDSLNPVISKMEQEVLKKKQKFKVEEKNGTKMVRKHFKETLQMAMKNNQ